MKYVNGLPDYYDLLEISKNATPKQIKHAFRLRAKEQHPDTGSDSPVREKAMRELLAAYETLIHEDLRKKYDIQYRVSIPQNEFNYREFLISQRHDPVSAGKLIFYDLLHDREDDALALYRALCTNQHFSLDRYMEREDFMDCAFLLAECFEKNKNYSEAGQLLERIIQFELDKPYFKHFFPVVLNKAKRITRPSIPGSVQLIKQFLKLPLKKGEKKYFAKKLSKLYSE